MVAVIGEKANSSPLLRKTSKKSSMGKRKKALGVLLSKSSKKPKRPPPPHLPGDIISDILSRLHVKTLCKLRCVSKSWLALTSDPYFRKSHLQRSKAKLLLLLTTFSPHSNTLNFYSFDTRGNLVSKTSNSQHMICSSISGVLSCLELVCMYQGSEDEPQRVYIGNPATGEVIMLPEEETYFDEGGERIQSHLAFGYLPSTGEYKVMRIFYCNSVDDFGLGAEIFTLSVDNEGGCRAVGDSWRDVCDPPCDLGGDATAVDGAIYFLPDYGLQKYSTLGVARFDLEKEKWSVIPLPAVPEVPLMLLRLREIGGKLFLVDHSKSSRKLLNMWLLQDIDKSVWVKEYSIDLSSLTSHYITPLAVTEDGGVLVKGNEKMLVYDPDSARFEDLSIEKKLSLEETGECYIGTTLYVESFLSLGRARSRDGAKFES